jgi:Holliday junction resolvase
MSGRRSRDKGCRFERELVRKLQDAGIAGERIPLSGSAGGSFCGDITIPVLGKDRRFEAKKRAGGFKLLYDFLADHYGLFVAQDRSTPLVVLRADHFIELVLAADRRAP